MTPSDLDALLEDVEAAQARIDAGTANMGEYDALSDAAPLLAAEVQRLRARIVEVETERDEARAAARFADQQGAEAIERVSRSIVADKWNATAAFQDRALKAERERDELRALLDEARAQIADFEDDFRVVIATTCAPDEQHCSCVPHLRRALEEARLTLAAEQGRQEGAPHPDWRAEGRAWCRVYADGTTARVSAGGTWCRGPVGDLFGRAGHAANARAAMQAADEVSR